MSVSIEIPEDLERRLRDGWRDLPRKALEAVAFEAYRTQALTSAEVGRLLGLESRFELEALLKRAGVDLDYSAEDLAADLRSIRAARPR